MERCKLKDSDETGGHTMKWRRGSAMRIDREVEHEQVKEQAGERYHETRNDM
jgi:hypothetical protein